MVDIRATDVMLRVVEECLLGLVLPGGPLCCGLALGVGPAVAVLGAVDAWRTALTQLGLGSESGGSFLLGGGLLVVVAGVVLDEPGAAPDPPGIDLPGCGGALFPLLGEFGQFYGSASSAVGAAGLAFVLPGLGIVVGGVRGRGPGGLAPVVLFGGDRRP